MKAQRTKKTAVSRAQSSGASGRRRLWNFWVPSWLRRFIEDYEAGKFQPDQFDAPVRFTRTYRWREVLPFIESGGDMARLCEMLKRDPSLLRHPVVWRLVLDIAQSRYGSSNSPAQLWEANTDWLKKIVEAWAQGMLSPGYTVQPPTRRGRKVSASERDFREGVAEEYKRLLDFLRNDPELKVIITKGTALKRQKRPFDSLEGPLAKVIRRIWEHPQHLHLSPDYVFNQVDPTPIPEMLVTQVVKAALDQKDLTGSMRDAIAYHLLAPSLGLEPVQVKSMVQEYRKSAGLTRRRKPTSKSRSTPSR